MTVTMSGPDDAKNPIRTIDVPSSASSPESVVRFLVAELSSHGQVSSRDVDAIVAKVMLRESLGSTNVGGGVAVPHIASALFNNAAVVAGRLQKPLSWLDVEKEPVRVVCLILAPDQRAMLRCLELVSRFLGNGARPGEPL